MRTSVGDAFKMSRVFLFSIIFLCFPILTRVEVSASPDAGLSVRQETSAGDGTALPVETTAGDGVEPEAGAVTGAGIEAQDATDADGTAMQNGTDVEGTEPQDGSDAEGTATQNGTVAEDGTEPADALDLEQEGVKDGLIKEGGAYYYYEDGERLEDSWKKLDGFRYYFTSNGSAATLSRKIDGIYYVFRKNGQLVRLDRKTVVKIAGYTFAVSKSGRALSGWNILDNRLYYARKDGSCISKGTRGTVRLSKKCFAVNSWKKLDAKKYYFKANGKMAVSSTKIRDKYYIFNPKGRLLQPKTESIRQVGDKRFHVTTKGTGEGGWFVYRDKLYFSTKSGRCISDQTKNDIRFNKKCEAVDSMATRLKIKDLLSVEGLADLKAQLQALIRGYGGTHCIYVKNLKTYEWMSINNMEMRPASLIKLYNMGTVYQLIKEGRLSETDYINSNLRSMITISSNDAYNNLLVQIGNGSAARGINTVNEFNQKYGFDQTVCGGTLSPSASSSVWLYRSHTSVRDCGNILEDIYRGCLVDEESSKKMLNLLLQQQRKWKIPSGLPQGVISANKTGEVYDFQHDAAIVFSDKADYVITVMTQGDGGAISHIGSISRVVYNYFN